jgi:LPS sulfotransferase NodH
MLNIPRWPVVIVGSPRTGSNVLTDTIAKQYGAKYFFEPGKNAERLAEFVEYSQGQDRRYVVKIFMAQTLGTDVYRDIFAQDYYRIKLSRRNELDQVLSFYIALMTNVWDETARTSPKYIVPINPERIQYSIDQVQLNNRMLAELDIEYDLELIYEDLGIVDNTEFVKVVPPVNYDRVRLAVESAYWARNGHD